MDTIPNDQIVSGQPKRKLRLFVVLEELKEKLLAKLPRLYLPAKVKTFLTLGGGIIVVCLVALFVVSYLRRNTKKPQEVAAPVDTSQLTLTTRRPSHYATDEAILKIESEVSSLEGELNSTQIKESKLNPPPLNWNVNFKE